MQQPWMQKQRKKICLPLEGLRQAEISREILLPPLPLLKIGLGRGGSWLHPFQSLRCIACTWAPLGRPCLPTRCSITGSGHDSAFLPQQPCQAVSTTSKKHLLQWLWTVNLWIKYSLVMSAQAFVVLYKEAVAVPRKVGLYFKVV